MLSFRQGNCFNGSFLNFKQVAPGNQELYSGHTTWTDYYSMYRIYKTYEFNLEAADTSAGTVSFSSRPGFLNSKDGLTVFTCKLIFSDWYNMDSNLVSMETTNGIYNNSLYDYVTPYCLLTWQRVIVGKYTLRKVSYDCSKQNGIKWTRLDEYLCSTEFWNL